MKQPVQDTAVMFDQSRDRLNEILEKLENPAMQPTSQDLRASIVALARIVRNHMLLIEALSGSAGRNTGVGL